MLKKTLLTKSKLQKIVGKFDSCFSWKGNIDKGIIFENNKLGVTIKYYGISDKNNNLVYDAIGIRERKGNSVVVLINQNKEIGLLQEYRVIPDKQFLSCVRGFADKDEKGIETALRELFEEAGEFKVVKSQLLGKVYQNTTFFEVPINVFLVKVSSSLKYNNRQDKRNTKGEVIYGLKFYQKKQILKVIQSNKIQCQMTLAALMLYFSKDVEGNIA